MVRLAMELGPEITIEALRAFARRRSEVDLRMVEAEHPYALRLHGHFDFYGHFFSILFRDIDHVDMAGGFPMGDFRLVRPAELPKISNKWKFDGVLGQSALVMRSGDAESWETAKPEELFVVIADRIRFFAGASWSDDDPIAAFLRIPVPPSGTREWDAWKAAGAALDDRATAVFLETLELGTEEEQYSALLQLRFRGYHAYATDHGTELRYEIRAPGETAMRVIDPRIKRDPDLPG